MRVFGGPVHVPVVAHLALMAACATVADVTTPGTFWVGAFAYAVLQGGRAVHELAHAWIGHKAGIKVDGVRLGVLTMAVDFAPDAIWTAQPDARRKTAAAGALAQALFGATLLIGAVVRQNSHATEPTVLIGLLHVAALTNLLPAQGSDGEYLFGRTFRPGWLALLAAVVLQTVVPLAATLHVFPNGSVHTYVQATDALYVALAVAIAVPVTQRIINAANGADSRAYISASARGVR